MGGRIILGGLVSIHSKGLANRECGELHSRLGVQRLEAMLFAVDQINANPKILHNITLGVEVYDTCSSETKALDKAVKFIIGRLSGVNHSSSSHGPHPPVVGVIGASYSSVSIQIAHLLRLFQIPQISFDSTSVELSDKKKFEYFSRTVPHDGFQAKAIVDVMRYFNWTYISSVYSDDTYGIHGMEALRKETKRAGQTHPSLITSLWGSFVTKEKNIVTSLSRSHYPQGSRYTKIDVPHIHSSSSVISHLYSTRFIPVFLLISLSE